jgi:L-Ala-D/L-Glu epimerase
MQCKIHRVDWPLAADFKIAYRTRTHAQTVVVELCEGVLVGRGEALGVSYHGETVDTIYQQIADVQKEVEAGVSRDQLRRMLPPGGARNAIDCALWDMESKRSARRAWEIAGFSSVRPLRTAYTLGINSPEAMGQAARAVPQYSLLKLKMLGRDDLERVEAVRIARPDVELIVDANQSWDEQVLHSIVPKLSDLGVILIEQPLPVGNDDFLVAFDSSIPLCADESCQTATSVSGCVGKYEYVNIKLDKTGGLTEALVLASTAQRHNFKLMVGCMAGSSLSMAPAFIVGQLCEIADLDGPLLASSDVPHAIRYVGDMMFPPSEKLWG